MNKLKAIAALTSLFIANYCFAKEIRFDGNFWRSLDQSQQILFINGVFQGLSIEQMNVFRSLLEASKTPEDAKAQREVASKKSDYFFKHVSSLQISDGLTAFYSEFKYRTIKIEHAIPIIAMQIRGENQKIIDIEIETWRNFGE
jgi:hypothetical protein